MGTVVKLPRSEHRRAGRVSAPTEATILFFLGVRYVRDREDAATETPPPRRGLVDVPLEIA